MIYIHHYLKLVKSLLNIPHAPQKHDATNINLEWRAVNLAEESKVMEFPSQKFKNGVWLMEHKQ